MKEFIITSAVIVIIAFVLTVAAWGGWYVGMNNIKWW